MKKAELRDIRLTAAELPQFKIRSKRATRVSGEFLLQQGTSQVNGVPVNYQSTYSIYPLEEVNHYAVCKDIFKKEGMAGVETYARKIKNHFENLKRLQ
jgi:hypothetical protein